LESMCPLGADGTAASRSVPFRTATATPKRERACWHAGNRGWRQMGWQSLRGRSRTSGVSTSDRLVGGTVGSIDRRELAACAGG
jgi:hypothetical protein